MKPRIGTIVTLIGGCRFIRTLAASLMLLTVLTGCRQQDNGLPTYPKMSQVLKTAEIVNIILMHDNTDGSKGIELSSQENKDMLLWLRASSKFHSQAPKATPDFLFNIFQYAGREEEPPPGYLYVCQTGELGYHNEWCYVPTEFKRRMLKIKASESVKNLR